MYMTLPHRIFVCFFLLKQRDFVDPARTRKLKLMILSCNECRRLNANEMEFFGTRSKMGNIHYCAQGLC